MKIFISSTWSDLQAERQAIERALSKMRDVAYIGMEYFGSRPETPNEVSLSEVDQCDLYIGIFAHRYGSVDPESDLSLTELEYRRAQKRGIPCLIYLKSVESPVLPRDIEMDSKGSLRLRALKDELQREQTAVTFNNPDQLAARVASDVSRMVGVALPFQPPKGFETEHVPFQAPRPPVGFVGREKEVVALRKRLLGKERFAAITGVYGMAGIGKSALAAFVANQLREEFPDGVLWVDTKGRETSEILGQLADAFDTRIPLHESVASQAALVQSMLTGKRALVVLDNIELEHLHDLNYLLPPAPCAVLITSRITQLPGISSSELLALDTFTEEEALQFLEKVLGTERINNELKGAKQIVQFLGHLPLALDIVARRLLAKPDQLLSDFATEVAIEHQHLEGLDLGPKDRSMRTALSLIYAQLDISQQSRFRCLAVFSGSDFGSAAVAAIGEEDENEVIQGLEQLTRSSLVTWIGSGRYQIHPIIRDYAFNQLKTANELKSTMERAKRYFLNFAEANAQLTPNALKALDIERDNIFGIMEWCFAEDLYDDLIGFTIAISSYLEIRGFWNESLNWLDRSRVACERLGDKGKLAAVLHNQADVYASRREFTRAQQLYSEALDVIRGLGDEHGEASILHNLASIAQNQRRYDDAHLLFQQSLEIKNKLGDQIGIASTFHQLGAIAQDMGNYDEARLLFQQSLEIKNKLGDQMGIASTLHQLGAIAQDMGNYDEARRRYQQSLEIGESLGNQQAISISLHQLGMIAQAQRDYDQARRLYSQSIEIAERLGNKRSAASTLYQLGAVAQDTENYDEAMTLYNKCFDTFKELQDQSGLAAVLHQLAAIAGVQGNYEKARQNFRESLDIETSLGNNWGTAATLASMGQLEAVLGNVSTAQELWQQCLQLFDRLKAPEAETIRKWLKAVR